MTPKSVLFVCLGNICRSPSAEAVFLSLIKERKISHLFKVDSAGTAGYHVGELADERMRDHAKRRNINLVSLSRKLNPLDLKTFDYIIGMDCDAFIPIDNKLKVLTEDNKVRIKGK